MVELWQELERGLMGPQGGDLALMLVCLVPLGLIVAACVGFYVVYALVAIIRRVKTGKWPPE